MDSVDRNNQPVGLVHGECRVLLYIMYQNTDSKSSDRYKHIYLMLE